MTVNHRQRRRHYWIALWAVLALLLNQTVAASHFCPNAALAAPHASALAQPGHSYAEAASASVGSTDPMTCSPAHDRSACTVHCSHAADGDQQVKAPTVPMLPVIGHAFPVALLDTVIATRSRTVGVVLDSRQRRLYEFCTLLI